MLDEMMLICLMLLLAGHGLLIRGCTKIHQSIPYSTNQLGSKFDGISTILDELADLIHEFGSPQQTSQMQKASLGGSIPEMLTTLFMNNIQQSKPHGQATHEWEVQENHPPNPKKTEDEPN